MSFPFGGKSRMQELAELKAELDRVGRQRDELDREVQELRELVGHQDGDRLLLHGAARWIRPGMAPGELALGVFERCFRAFDLASFYVALMNWERDRLSFLLYHEGGRSRPHPARRLSENPGLTGQALRLGGPLYIRTTEEAERRGAVFTEAEKGSGLVPASWYGVPLGLPERPLGLLSFQSFQPDAFSLQRRETMDALGAMLGLALACSEPSLNEFM